MRFPFLNTVRIKLVSSDVVYTLQKLMKNQIPIYDVEYIDDFTVHFTILKKEKPTISKIMEKMGIPIVILAEYGPSVYFRLLKRRMVIGTTIVLILLLSFWMPSRVWFVRVEGNSKIPTAYILECAKESGVFFGVSRKSIRNETFKNNLITKIPDLKWVGINTEGCVATIHVKEKSETIDLSDVISGYHIVASTDGVVYSYTIEKGMPLCKVGDVVQKGQMLVSGYEDTGLQIVKTKADAEVFALTNRQLDVVSMNRCSYREEIQHKQTRYSLQIGKNLIKFYNDSGISAGTCVKIYEEKYITLPGGFSLPLIIITETICEYSVASDPIASQRDATWLIEYACDYIQRQMIAGKVLTNNCHVDDLDEICVLHGDFSCLEMISKYKSEEI